jgi:hypothetical protein
MTFLRKEKKLSPNGKKLSMEKFLPFLALVGAELRIDSVLRPKNAQNSTKNGKNQLLQKKFFNFSMDQFSSFYGKNKF